jgi:hypothetical protein
VRSAAQARIPESTPIGSDERVCAGEDFGQPALRAVENTSRSKWRLAPRLESPSASRALHAAMAARRTRRVNREVARYDRALATPRPTVSRTAPDLPGAEKDGSVMTIPRQEPPLNKDGTRRKKRRMNPLRKPPVQSQHGDDDLGQLSFAPCAIQRRTVSRVGTSRSVAAW